MQLTIASTVPKAAPVLALAKLAAQNQKDYESSALTS
jgi:hypothetical protein